MLALVDKIYKKQKQILLDRINFRENVIRNAGNKLQKLSPISNKNQIYNDGVYEYDTVGIPFLAALGRKLVLELDSEK